MIDDLSMFCAKDPFYISFPRCLDWWMYFTEMDADLLKHSFTVSALSCGVKGWENGLIYTLLSNSLFFQRENVPRWVCPWHLNKQFDNKSCGKLSVSVS